MNIIVRIVKENLRYHKSKNILIGIAVFLTTLLLFLVPSVGKNMIDGQYAAINEVYPNWHALFRDVDAKTIDRLSSFHNIASSGLRSDAGYIVNKNSQIALIYMDNKGFSLSRLKLLEGKLPEKENDIVISSGVLKELEQPDKKVGDRINIPYQILRDGSLAFREEKEFVITGITESDSSAKKYTAYVSKKFLENEIPENQILYYFLFQVNGTKKSITDDLEKDINRIAKIFSIPEKNILINKDYLMANYIDPSILSGILGILAIIIIAGIITIYSIYYIGMTERIQEFGKLKAIGATKFQMIQIVLGEGLGIALVAVPIGLVMGTIISKRALMAFLSLYKNENLMAATMKKLFDENQITLYHWWIYLLTIIIAVLTVCISLAKPMKIASKLSETDAIRYQSDDLERRKKKRQRNKKSFSNISVLKLSYIFLIGSKKNSMITILSMGMTGILLMVIATVLSCANPIESANNSILGQYQIQINAETGNKEHPEREWDNIIKNNPLNESLRKKIEEIDGVTEVAGFGFVKVSAEIFEDNTEGICGIPEEYAKELEKGIIEGNTTFEELKSGDKVILDKTLLHWYPTLSIGDTIELTMNDSDRSYKKAVKIVAIGDYPLGFTNYNYLLMADEGAKKLSTYNINEVYHIFAKQKYNRDTEQALKELIGDDSNILELQTWKASYDEWSSAITMVSGVCYLFFCILGAICVMNIINTMIHNVHVRKKEIGMMQALGMTDRQLLIMLQQEGLFYTIGTLLLSIGLGSILGYPIFLWSKYNGIFSISHYHYPTSAAIIISVVLILIQFVLTLILGKSVRKESLIDRIRFSE